MRSTPKRLLAVIAGALGLRAILRRRRRPAPGATPADELKAKLAATKEPEPVPQPVPAPEPSAPEPTAEPDGVDERRADTHARARQAIEELREKSDQ